MELSKKGVGPADLAKIFKALSNPQRLKLFEMLYRGEMPVTERPRNKMCCPGLEKAFTLACRCMSLSRSTVSHHFKELQNASLISCERRGQAFFCEVNPKAVQAIQNFMK